MRFPRFSVLPLACPTLLVAFSLTPYVHAQRYLGSITGEVSDASGAKVPGAEVVAEELSTHFRTSIKANDSGAYNFSSLNPGTYSVTLTAPSFKVVTRSGLILTAGQQQVLDFKLEPGAASESIDISADNTLLDSGSANIATTISEQEVTDLPYNGRNPFTLATLAPGVYSGNYLTGKASGFNNPFSGTAVQIITQGSSGHNRITLNGIPDDPPERFSGATYTGFVPSPEAVQEVKVQTSAFDAQVGHGNGTLTNTVVRGGSNTLHGAAYYVFQNTYINANTSDKAHYQSTGLTAYQRGNDQLSQTGFVIDGPVVIPHVYNGRDKTFFMASYERYQSHSNLAYSARVPTVAERAGDFSGLCSVFNAAGLCTSGVQIYNPNSSLDANGNRTQYYANNNLAGAINPAGAALLSYLPLPNVPGSNETTNPNYFSTQSSYLSTYPSFIVRFDQVLGHGERDKLSAIFFRAGLSQNYPLQGFPKGIGPATYGYSVYRNTRGGSLDEVHQFSSSMVLDSRFGLVFHPFGLQYPGNAGFNLSQLSISSAGLPYTSFPGTTETDGYATLAGGSGGQVSASTNGSLEEILTKQLGRHNLRIGFEGDLLRYNVAQSPLSGFGSFGFDRHFTQQNANTATAASGDPVASELLGAFSSVSYSISATYALQQLYMAPFVQDDWRVSNKLTVNLGLRYDYESPLTERYNKQLSNFCTTCVNPVQSAVTGIATPGGLQFTSASNRFPYPRDLNNIQPRVGAAYQATPTTVVRAGFGIIYFNTLETPIGTGFSQSTSYTNYSGTSAPLFSMTNPFPQGVTPVTGSSLGLGTALGQSISFIDPNHVTPKEAEYTLNVQQQLPGNLALQVAYVGTRATRLEVNHNINILPASVYNQGGTQVNYLNANLPNPFYGKLGGTSSLNSSVVTSRSNLLLPFPEFGSVTEQYSSIGSSPYNALQIQVSRPMRHHFSFQGNFTWDKIMLHNAYIDNYAAVTGHLESIQDNNPTLTGNIFAVVQLPKLEGQRSYTRLLLGGWQANTITRFANGPLIPAPGNVDIIGDYHTPGGQNFYRNFNTCYQTQTINGTTGAVTVANQSSVLDSTLTYYKTTACDAMSPTPAFRQRIAFTSQSNPTYLNIRYALHPVADLSLFKQFIVREGVSFEIRGEFFNILNTPNFGAPNQNLGAANTASRAGSGSLAAPLGVATQINDPRIGQLTARINF